VEHDLDTTILDSFLEVINGLKKKEEKNFEQEKLRMKQAARQENKMENMRTIATEATTSKVPIKRTALR
jgi:hypothetical protein